MRFFSAAVATALFVTGAMPAVARAGDTADLRAFVARTKTLTFADFKRLRLAPLPHETDQWTAADRFGPSLSRCLIVDLPTMESIFGGPAGVAESALQCDGARRDLPQKTIVAWALATISPLLPGYALKRYPAKRPGDRSSLVWTGPHGVSYDFIAMGASDYKGKKGKGLGYNVSVSVDNPTTPRPAPTDETPQ